MTKLSNVEGNPYRDSSGRFDDSPYDYLKSRGSKTYVAREDNEKKIKGLKSEAEKRLKALRDAANEPDDTSVQEYNELEHQQKVQEVADVIRNLDEDTDDLVVNGEADELKELLLKNEFDYSKSEIEDAIVLLHQNPYYTQFIIQKMGLDQENPNNADEGLARAMRDNKELTPEQQKEREASDLARIAELAGDDKKKLAIGKKLGLSDFEKYLDGILDENGEKIDKTVKEQSKETAKPKAAPVTANALDHKIDLVVKNQISARDFPHVYEDLGINLSDLGCIMLDTEPIDIMEQIQDLYESANIYYGEPEDQHYGIPATTEPHVTLLYGLLQNGHVWRDKVNEMLMGWTCPELTVQKVSYFDIGKAFAVIALLKKTPELIDGHERLTLLPHVNTFSEYVPHVSLVYVDKTVDVDALVKKLNKQLKGATLKTTGINYGHEPENVENDNDDYDEPEQTSDSKAVEADVVEQTDTLTQYKAKALQTAENGSTEHFLAHEGDGHDHTQEIQKVVNSLTEDQQAITLLEQANLDTAVKNLDQDIVNAVVEQLQKGNIRAAEELITEAQEGAFVNLLVTALVVYGLAMLPLYAMQLLFMRTNGSGIWDSTPTDPSDPDYEFSDDLKKGTRPSAQSHVRTILKDTTRVINEAYDKETEKQLQKLIDEKLAAQDEGYDRAELYKIARTRAKKGESLQEIIKAVQAAAPTISDKRAKVLSRNEQFRIFTMSQFEADRQFINQTGNSKRAYKKLVSMSGNPCPVCNLIIERTAVNPIPFHKNFANLHDELEAEYIKENGDAGRMKLKLNFAPIESGNVHVNCHCRYQLLLKNDDGTFLNAFEGDQYTLKATNSMDFDPTLHPRDDKGRFKDKVGMHIEELYKSYPTLEADAKNLAKLLSAKAKSKDILRKEETGTDLWWELYEANGVAKKAYTKQLHKAIDNMGIDLDMVNGLQYEWSGGNGPRGEDGYYIATPELQENVGNSNVLKAQYLTQATLFELGLTKVKVYRGEKVTAKHEARGLVSFSTSKTAAESFGWTSKYVTEKHPHTGEDIQVRESVEPNLIEKEVPLTAVLTHHYVLFDTEYETEREVIVDTDKL